MEVCLKETMQRLTKHVLTNMTGTAVDMLVLWLCSDYLLQGYAGEYLLSPLISFECACVVNFLIASRFVWGDRLQDSSNPERFRRFVGYNLSCTGIFLVKMGFLLLIHLLTKKDVVLCNLIALLFTGLLSFTINDLIIFRRRKTTHGDKTSQSDPDISHQPD